jgi:hypothetical protein
LLFFIFNFIYFFYLLFFSKKGQIKFEVTQRTKVRAYGRKVISIDFNERLVNLYEVKTQNITSRPIKNLLKISRSKKSNKKIKLWWSREDGGCERYVFLSAVERESFYEICWVARSNITRVVNFFNF